MCIEISKSLFDIAVQKLFQFRFEHFRLLVHSVAVIATRQNDYFRFLRTQRLQSLQKFLQIFHTARRKVYWEIGFRYVLRDVGDRCVKPDFAFELFAQFLE